MEMHWSGVDWIGLVGIEPDSIGFNWIQPSYTQSIRLNWILLKCIGLDWIGLV